jgi:TadE-like protein
MPTQSWTRRDARTLASPIYRPSRTLLFPSNICMKFKKSPRKSGSSTHCLGGSGGVAAEFALVAPIIILLATGIADFGMLASNSTALTAAVRIGTEYARFHATDTVGIRNSMQSSMSFMPTLTFPASFPQSCECDNKSFIACSESCATTGRPGPNRVFITISATQAFAPLVPWPGVPNLLTATAQIRLQ